MAMHTWLDAYPRVKALLQTDADMLDYGTEPDPDVLEELFPFQEAVGSFTLWSSKSEAILQGLEHALAHQLLNSLPAFVEREPPDMAAYADLTHRFVTEILADEQAGIWGPCGHRVTRMEDNHCRYCGYTYS